MYFEFLNILNKFCSIFSGTTRSSLQYKPYVQLLHNQRYFKSQGIAHNLPCNDYYCSLFFYGKLFLIKQNCIFLESIFKK